MPKSKRKTRKIQFKIIMSVIILVSSTCLYINHHEQQSSSHQVNTTTQSNYDENPCIFHGIEPFNAKKMHIEQLKYQREVKRKRETQQSQTPQQTQTYIKKFEATITSYTAGQESTGKSKGDVGYGITTSGKHVQEGVTLSCPSSIPLGTWVEIEDIGKRECQDRGAAIKYRHFDLYMSNLQDAIQFGVQNKMVYILGSES